MTDYDAYDHGDDDYDQLKDATPAKEEPDCYTCSDSGCPEGGLVVDPFAGSGSTLMAARMTGRRGIAVEGREDHCEAAAKWLGQLTFTTPA